MILHLHPLSVTLIDRDVPLAVFQVPAGFPLPAADDLEDTVDPFKWVVCHEHATFWWHVSEDSLGAKASTVPGALWADHRSARYTARISKLPVIQV